MGTTGDHEPRPPVGSIGAAGAKPASSSRPSTRGSARASIRAICERRGHYSTRLIEVTPTPYIRNTPLPIWAPSDPFAAIYRPQMATRLHAIVQDPQYLDFEIGGGAIQKEMPPAASASRDKQSAKSRQDVVPDFGPEDIGAGREFAHGQEKRPAISTCASRAEPFCCPAQNAGEISSASAPSRGRHRLLGTCYVIVRCAGRSLSHPRRPSDVRAR